MAEDTSHTSGQRAFQRWRDRLLADPEFRRVYKEEAAKKELWLALAEARQDAGLTQAEFAVRIGVSPARMSAVERRGYDICSATMLRHYIETWATSMGGCASGETTR